MKTSGYTIAVVGATGLVGREIVTALDQRAFPVAALHGYATLNSVGEDIQSGLLAVEVEALTEQVRFDDIDLLFLAAGERVTAEWAARAADRGATAIDLSGLYIGDLEVPLIVPEVNGGDIASFRERNMISSPDAVTIALALVLEPLRALSEIQRVVATTFEPVSSAGRAGIAELERQTRDLMSGRETDAQLFPQRIAFNALPHVGEFLAGGSSHGEDQTTIALRRVLSAPDLALSITRVRVPVFFGTGVSVNVELASPVAAADIAEHLRQAPSLLIMDDTSERIYPSTADSVGNTEACVGRIRSTADPASVDLWLSVDNTRKGSAVNAVQIAELLSRDYL